MKNKNKKDNGNEEKIIKKNNQEQDQKQGQSLQEEKNLDEINNETSSKEEQASEKSEQDILREELEQLRDERLRLLAEMENLRKRTEKEKIDSIKYGSFNFAKDILQIDDNLSRALEAIPKDDTVSTTVKNLIDGLKMVQKDFGLIVEKHGIKKIEALNKKFDHNFHQAMVEIENQENEEGLVIQEMQSGYTMYDRLLRPSMVGVSKKPKKDKEKN